MIVDCIADLHGYEPKLPGGDLLLLVGDYTASHSMPEWCNFFRWLKNQPYKKKILIAGNHDNFFESGFPKNKKEIDELKEVQEDLDFKEDFEYLCDSKTEYEGLKIWGTPWTTWFQGVHPKCKAFMRSERRLANRFNLIPEGIDILISHTPMFQVLDTNIRGASCGSKALKEAVDRAKPRFHIFGHIHEQGGNQLLYKHEGSNTWCINCSFVNVKCRPVFNHIRLSL